MSETNPIINPQTQLQSGARLGKYIVLHEIGRGGMAVVYQAHQPDLDRVVAAKVLFGSMLQQRFIERFQGEARALAKLSHPNVIRIFEVGEQEGTYFLIMEFIDGKDLLSYLHEKRPSFDEVLDIIHQLAEALGYCHKQGILHRDLKPINILMRGSTPVLIDFGLAKALDPDLNVSLTLSGEVVGSPAYMSPEQAQGMETGVLSDICALGIILYELISFKNPYLDPRSLHQTALNAIQAEPVPLHYLCPWLNNDFEAMVSKAMAKNPDDRYQNMDLFLQDLHAFRLGQPISAKPPGFFMEAWRFVKGSPVLYLGLAFILVMAAVIGGFMAFQHENQKSPFGLVLEESFSNPDTMTPFTSLDLNGVTWEASKSWNVIDGHLEGLCTGLCTAVMDQEFFGDLRIEFEVQGLDGQNSDFNVFLFGPTPDEAFRFTLGEWGSGRAGIDYGPRMQYSHGRTPVKLNGGIPYKVTLEKEGHTLRLSLDDQLLVEKFYPLPVKIDRHSKIGFYTWKGGLSIDHIRIYKKAIALAASPTVVADAYLEEGFIKRSIPAYLHVIETYTGKSASFEAHLKLAKGYMVLRNYSKAIDHLTIAAGGTKNPNIVPEALYHLAQCQFQTGHDSDGYERLKLLQGTFPQSEFNRAVVENRTEAVYRCLDQKIQPALCLPIFSEEFRFLIENEDLFRSVFGRYHAHFLELFRKLGSLDALNNAASLIEYYSGIPSARLSIRHTLMKNALGLGNKGEAQSFLVSGKDDPGDNSHLKAEQSIMAGISLLFQGQASAAAELLLSAQSEFIQISGQPFRCIVHAQVAQLLAGRVPNRMEGSFFVNDAVSRRERVWLAFLQGKISRLELQKTLEGGPETLPSLEEELIEYLWAYSQNGESGAQIEIQSSLKKFPPKSFEAAYLSMLATQSAPKTVFTP